MKNLKPIMNCEGHIDAHQLHDAFLPDFAMPLIFQRSLCVEQILLGELLR